MLLQGSTFEYTVVFADPRSPNFKMRDIGKTVVGEVSEYEHESRL